MNDLFVSDLAFTRPTLEEAGVSGQTADGEAQHRGRMYPRFTPPQWRQGEHGPRGWNITSEPATGTKQVATRSSERWEIQMRGPAP